MSPQFYISVICSFVCLLTIPMIAEENKPINGTSSGNKSADADKNALSVYCRYHRKPKLDKPAGWDHGDKWFTKQCCYKHGTCKRWADGDGGERVYCRVNSTGQESKMKKCCASGTDHKYLYRGESQKYPKSMETLMIPC